jgi:hypothetical protein
MGDEDDEALDSSDAPGDRVSVATKKLSAAGLISDSNEKSSRGMNMTESNEILSLSRNDEDDLDLTER